MTTIIHISTDKGYKHINCQHHAGDMRACAAISLVSSALVDYLVSKGVTFKYHLDEGAFDITFKGFDDVFEFVCRAYWMVAIDYPDFCKIIEE